MRAKHLSSGLNLVVKDLVTDIGFRANLVLPCGGITLLLGANGAGKSTLLKTILGLRTKNFGHRSSSTCDAKRITKYNRFPNSR